MSNILVNRFHGENQAKIAIWAFTALIMKRKIVVCMLEHKVLLIFAQTKVDNSDAKVIHLFIEYESRKETMATKKPRFNVTLDENTASILNQLADHESKSISSLAKELILEALELREDMALAAIAERAEKKSKKLIAHKDAWK